MQQAEEYNQKVVGQKLKTLDFLPENIKDLANKFKDLKCQEIDLIAGQRFPESVYDIICQADNIPTELSLEWTKLQSMPTCAQECGVGIIHNHIIYTCGYCAGLYKGGSKNKKAVRGFSKACFAFNLETNKWKKLPNFPGQGRQGLRTTVLNNELYFWGGWTYQPMRAKQINNIPSSQWPQKKGVQTFSDGFKLSMNEEGDWVWSSLPPMPFPRTNFGICTDNKETIYICAGGHVLNGQMTSCTEFNTLYKININDIESRWIKLDTFQGTMRINCSMAFVNDQIWILGGMFPNIKWKYQNTVVSRWRTSLDQWKYNVLDDKWSETTKNITEVSNWGGHDQIVFNNRYIILAGGSYFPEMVDCNNIVLQKLKPCLCHRLRVSHCACGNTFLDRIFAFDVLQQKFIKSDVHLPGLINLPILKIYKDEIYILGGESYSFTFKGEKFPRPHLDICAKASISLPLSS
tara:strand:+ start:5333 stop:6718 length:1386 start_codon:yes stop_codon:yes gene_type:complete